MARWNRPLCRCSGVSHVHTQLQLSWCARPILQDGFIVMAEVIVLDAREPEYPGVRQPLAPNHALVDHVRQHEPIHGLHLGGATNI